jgi:phosphatidylglycerol---prolipoprotein diacylglyceryl transferase
MTHATTHWVHDLDPMLLRIYGDIGIRYYGLAYVLAFAIAFALLSLMRKRRLIVMNPEQQSALFSYLVLGVFLGGRIGYTALYTLDEWIRHPLLVFEIWHGGMSSHGGFVGVIVALALFARRHQLPLRALGDAAVVMTPPGLLLGRIANFINGELWGIPSQVPWAVIFPLSAPAGTPVADIPARHPSQLYEAGLEGLLLMLYTSWRMFGTKATQKPGNLAAEFLILYAIVRIIGEQFRAPDATLIAGLSRGSFFSLFLIAGGLGLLAYNKRYQRSHHGRTE